MPPKRASKPRTTGDDEADVEIVTERSRGLPNVETDLSNVMQEGQKRQVIKRRQAEKSQVEAFAQVQEELAALDNEHSKQLSQLRRQQLIDLRELLQDKANIESEVVASMQTLQQAYKSTYQELKCAMVGRISDLGKAADSTIRPSGD